MNTHNRITRLFALLLALVMVVGLFPLEAFHVHAADSEPIVLIAGGDYQQAGDHANSSENVTNILKKIVSAGYTSVDGFLFIGDYDCETHDSTSETSAGIASLMNTVSSVYSNINDSNSILVQGNHDAPDSRIDATGGHDFEGYSVFVMNEDDYPNYGGSESQAKALAEELDEFLSKKLNSGFSAPIFITSHVPLHFGPRTNKQGDGKYASYIFDVLNAYGAEGLNLIFMHGHNHAYGYDEYLGGEAIYLAVGDKINIAKTGSQSSYNTYTLNFTYMNAGYTGDYNESGYSTSSGTNFLTMTTFEIYDDEVIVGRYSANGIYNLKTAGEKKGDYISSVSVSANTDVYASTQTITLTAPAERITLEDSASGVTVTGLKVDGSFDDASDLTVTEVQNISILDNSAKCTAYRAYNLDFVCSGTAVITLPVPNSYNQSTTKVYYIDGNTLTEMDATISGSSGAVTAAFTATHDGTYAVVNETAGNIGSVYYERVDEVNDLVSGEQYLIVFDCSSQTTADAIVIPEISSYNSGSSLRKGPDVVVSDGITDESIISGDYDAYVWTLTKSGNGWLIGNGSQNINVTYSSTTSRCELDFTASGEALTIASASSNPSDADAYSFAIYDSSNYYWQYNTSATLVYGTNGDSYTSRFIFYKKVDNTASSPESVNGWIQMPSGGTYVLDTDGIDTGKDNKYIIVGNNNAYALTVSNGSVSQEAVTINGNTISVDNPSIYEFYFADNSSNESKTYLLTQDGSNTVYHANGNMYYGSDNKGYWYLGSSSNGSYQIYDIDNNKWYLNYGYVWSSESTNRFAVSSNSRYVRLYKCVNSVLDDTCIRLAGETEQTYANTAGTTVNSVLENAYIEVTTDGYYISDVISLSADQVTWSPAFNGTEAGTYTGTVTYEGMDLGTITVTITNDHSYEASVVSPTCTEQGYTVYTCTDCGDSYVADYVDATGHSYESVVTNPTCTEQGYTTYTCSACGDSYIDNETDALGHSYETVTIEPTCTEAGSITYTCECGHSYVEAIEATGHDYTAVVTAPTCTEKGFTTYTCACGDSYVADYVDATGHSYETAVTAPTCTEAGFTTYTCTECSDSFVSDETAALGHDFITVTVDPTCTEGGYTTDTCTVCGESTIYNETAPLGHDYRTETKDATCTVGGYTIYTCACGDTYISDETDALGHNNTSVVTEATCEAEGYTTHTCTVCGEVTVDSIVAALGHSYETVITDATCTENGSVTRTCTVCGDTSTEVIEATGHSYEAVVTSPICTEGGYTTCTCGVCGSSYISDETDALGHSYSTVESDGNLIHTCDRCGDSYTEIINWIQLGNVYTLDTDGVDIGENHKYIVVGSNQNYALTLSGSTIGSTAVTVDGNTITLDNGSAYEFYFADNSSRENGTYLLTRDGSSGVYHMGGNMYYGSDNKGYWYIGSGSNGAYQIYDYDNLNWFLNYGYVWASDSVSRFAVSSNTRTVRLFKSSESYVRLAGELTQVCTDADGATESTILDKVTIQTSTDGSTVSGTVAVTSAMVNWDQEFDGTTAGTYTASVTYNGAEIGTITVTVTSKHVYETTVVAPTCTEGGYTVRSCSECGVRYESDHTEALGHSYTCVESDGYLIYTCDRCGDSYSEKSATYTRVSSIASGNKYVITLYSGNKYYAVSHANNTLSVVQVTVSNGEITSEITEDLLWNYSGSKLSYSDGGTTYYLYSSRSGWWGNNYSLSLSTSNSSSVSFSSSKLKIGSYYLRYSSGTVTVNRSATTTYMFQEG